jgi:hypothetical protein
MTVGRLAGGGNVSVERSDHKPPIGTITHRSDMAEEIAGINTGKGSPESLPVAVGRGGNK